MDSKRPSEHVEEPRRVQTRRDEAEALEAETRYKADRTLPYKSIAIYNYKVCNVGHRASLL